MKRRKYSIQFSCPRCTSRVEAPARHAGAKLRCPFCYHLLEVPQESSPDARGEEYSVSDAAAAQPGAQGPPSYLTVICPVCDTRMYATEDQLGQEMVCPDCGTRVLVRRPLASEVHETPRLPLAEEYPLYQGEGQPPPSSREVYRAYIPVVCRVCATRMLATEEQVGQEMVCPDCNTSARVPPLARKPPAERGRESTEVGHEDAYDLRQGPPAQGARPGQQRHLLVTCGVCHARLHATADQAGREILCPDCFTPLVVPQAAPETEAAQGPAEPMEEYHLGAPAERAPLIVPGFEPIVDDRPLRPIEPRDEIARQAPRGRSSEPRSGAPTSASSMPVAASEAPDMTLPAWARRWSSPDREPPPLRWPLFSGVFDFPFYPGSRVTLLLLSIGSIILAGLALAAVRFSQIPDPVTYFASAGLSGLTGLVALFWIVLTSGRCLNVIRETAAGCDEVQYPTDLLWMDWVFQCVYPLFSIAISVLLGMGMNGALRSLGLMSGLGIPLSLFLLFPVVLLSMLERESPLMPFSPTVWGSLIDAWRAWGLFYLETLLLAAGIGPVAWLVVLAGTPWVTVPGAVVVAAVLGWATMVYCRLLGRLAWCCVHASREEGERL